MSLHQKWSLNEDGAAQSADQWLSCWSHCQIVVLTNAVTWYQPDETESGECAEHMSAHLTQPWHSFGSKVLNGSKALPAVTSVAMQQLPGCAAAAGQHSSGPHLLKKGAKFHSSTVFVSSPPSLLLKSKSHSSSLRCSLASSTGGSCDSETLRPSVV